MIVSAAELRLAREQTLDATEGLIEVLREYRGTLGSEDADLRLRDAATMVAENCPPCERALERELGG